jgi:DNA-binding NarL/FixJ family response regulator
LTTCGKGNSLSRLPERENPPGDVPGPWPSLTEEEVRILRLMAEGQATQGIADELGVPYSTARRRIEAIVDKLQVRSRFEAIVFAVRHGLVRDT